jgi:hypothetical protein
MLLDGPSFSSLWTSRLYAWHKRLRQSIFLIFPIYASDPSARPPMDGCGMNAG